MSRSDPHALFVFCSPCCEDCPTVYPDRSGYVISDPERPDRGRVALSGATLRTLVGEQGLGLALPWKLGTLVGTSLLAEPFPGVSITTVSLHGANMIRLAVGEGRMLFLPEEWNALFASPEARQKFATLLRHRAKAHGASATA